MANKNTINAKLVDEAEAWLVRLRSDDISVEEKVRFSDWLNSSDEHAEAFDQICAIWETLGAVAFIPEFTSRERAGRSLSEKFVGGLHRFWAHTFKFPLQTGLALTCLVALVTVSFQFTPTSEDAQAQAIRYATQAGQLLEVTLEDGSQVQLNTQTVLEVLYLEQRRQLTLVKGEAYFDVAPDKERPFVVEFGKGSATAVGTEFNIYRERAATAVTVTEGIVDVREAPDLVTKSPAVTRVVANQQIKVGRRGLSPIRNVQPSRAVAWRDNTIIFKDTPLRQAFDQLERYLHYPIDASDVFDEKVSGTFSLTSPDETLDALVTAFHLTKNHSSPDNTLYLRSE